MESSIYVAENIAECLETSPIVQLMIMSPFFHLFTKWKKTIGKSLKSQLDFSLCSQAPFMDKIMKNKRGLELATSLSLGCKTFRKIPFFVIFHLSNFDGLIQSSFWVIPKIIFNLCKPFYNVIIIPVLFDPLNLETVENKEEKGKTMNILRTKIIFLMQ